MQGHGRAAADIHRLVCRQGLALRPHQAAMLEAAAAGVDALLIAPTGGGKTLAGFLPSLVELAAGAAVAGCIRCM